MDIKSPVKDTTSEAKRNIDRAESDAQDVANDASARLSAIVGDAQGTVLQSLERNPLGTLAMAIGAGFVVGALWKR
jgi:ElaB/YqjD/DUF883 family membrane-anchored ribosome-binding protein